MNNSTSNECFVCRKHRGEVGVPGGMIYENDLIYISHAQLWGEEKEHYLGHVFVEPKRHVAEVADLTEEEAQVTGIYTSRIAKALLHTQGMEHICNFVKRKAAITELIIVHSSMIDQAMTLKQVLGENVTMVQADVTEPATLPPLLAGADFVISAIGVSGRGEASPEDVDYGGSLALIDASKSAGIKKFIMVTSGGVTWWTHPINWFSGGVLKWKRKAEQYLRASGLPHVIVRPNGGLTDKPGNSNKIMFTQSDGFPSSISREDVAIVCVKALVYKEASNKTFEIKNSGDGQVTSAIDWTKSFGALIVQSDNF